MSTTSTAANTAMTNHGASRHAAPPPSAVRIVRSRASSTAGEHNAAMLRATPAPRERSSSEERRPEPGDLGQPALTWGAVLLVGDRARGLARGRRARGEARRRSREQGHEDAQQGRRRATSMRRARALSAPRLRSDAGHEDGRTETPDAGASTSAGTTVRRSSSAGSRASGCPRNRRLEPIEPLVTGELVHVRGIAVEASDQPADRGVVHGDRDHEAPRGFRTARRCASAASRSGTCSRTSKQVTTS